MKTRILVVDDEVGWRDMFVFLLEPLGFEVTCVENGFEGVQKIRENDYSVVLMDVHMPVLSGPEALKEIHKIRPSQKVIIFSSSSDPEHILEKEAETQGIIACLYKPVELAEIQRVLEKSIGTLPQTL
ncbi:MAG: response regulator [Candidatus Omnitrophica bacterium]|nr:response regulator [Candidatus Omnitrophota bacterium]